MSIYQEALDKLDTPTRMSVTDFLDLYELVVGRYDVFARNQDLMVELRDEVWRMEADGVLWPSFVPAVLLKKFLEEKQMNVAAFIWVLEEVTIYRLINPDGSAGTILAALAKDGESVIAQALRNPHDWMELQEFILNEPACSVVRRWFGQRFLGRDLGDNEAPAIRVVGRLMKSFGVTPLTRHGEPMRLERKK